MCSSGTWANVQKSLIPFHNLFYYHTFISSGKSCKDYSYNISSLNYENVVLSNRITLTVQEVILVLDQFGSSNSLCLSNGILAHSDSGFESCQPALQKLHSQVLKLSTVYLPMLNWRIFHCGAENSMKRRSPWATLQYLKVWFSQL